jgi:hypothetical protein
MVSSRNMKQSLWLILAVALMSASAICALLYMDAMGKISGWTGLAQYERYIPQLRRNAALWSGLALLFPFLAALLLGFVKEAGSRHSQTARQRVISDPTVSQEWTLATAALKYLLRLAISVLASVALMAVFILAILLLNKLGVRTL